MKKRRNDDEEELTQKLEEINDMLEDMLDDMNDDLEKELKQKKKEKEAGEAMLDLLLAFAPKDDLTNCFKIGRRINNKLNLVLSTTTKKGGKSELAKNTSKFYMEIEALIDQYMKYADIKEAKEETK